MEALAGAITDEFDPALDDTVLRAITAEVDASLDDTAQVPITDEVDPSLDDTVILPESPPPPRVWSLTVAPHLSRHRLHPESPLENKLALLQQPTQQAANNQTFFFFQVLDHRTPEGTMYICAFVREWQSLTTLWF